jgi:hypothetical protein
MPAVSGKATSTTSTTPKSSTTQATNNVTGSTGNQGSTSSGGAPAGGAPKSGAGTGSVASSKGPGASQAAAKASAAGAPKSSAPGTGATGKQGSPTGSGVIGSKGGGASTQQPGAGGLMRGGGPVSPMTNDYSKAVNQLNRPTAGGNVPPATPKTGVGQGFINKYSSPIGPQKPAAPQAPTAGRSAVVPTAPPQKPGILGNKYASPIGPQKPVTPGSPLVNPNMPDSVKKALAERGFNPDGTRMDKGIVADKYRYPIGPTFLSDEGNIPWNKTPQKQVSVTPGPMTPSMPQTPKVVRPGQLTDEGSLPDLPGIQRVLSGLVDSILGPPSVPAPMQMRPGFQFGNPQADIPGLTYQGDQPSGPLMGMQPTAPNLAQAISGEVPTFTGPRAGTAPPANMPNVLATDPVRMAQLANLVQKAQTGQLLGSYAPAQAPAKQFTDRVPQASGLPPATGEERIGAAPAGSYSFPTFNMTDNMLDRALSEVQQNGFLNPAPDTPSRAPAAPGPVTGITYQGRGVGDAPTGADIAGVGNEATAPASMQKSYTVQRGDTLSKIASKNGTTVKAIAKANGIKNPNAIKPGQKLSIPTNASVQPMGGTAFSDPSMVNQRLGLVSFSALADENAEIPGMLGTSIGSPSLDQYGNVGGEVVGTLGNRGIRQNAAIAPASPQASTSPSQQGDMEAPSQQYDGGPDENPSQDASAPEGVRQHYNRYKYEKERLKGELKDGVMSTPGRVAQAIRDGDFRNYNGAGNFPADRSNFGILPQGQPYAGAPQSSGGSSSYNDLVARLIAALEQQGILPGGTPSQSDLVLRTFV